MICDFDTDDRARALAALLVYAGYRSRDQMRHPGGPDLWGYVERSVRLAARSARSIGQFLQGYSFRLHCPYLRARSLACPELGDNPLLDLDADTERRVLDLLYTESQYLVMLVRARVERERQRPEVLPPEEEEDVVGLEG